MHMHLRENEAQLNEMLQEYWRLRHQVGEFFSSYLKLTMRMLIHPGLAVYMEMLGTQMGFQLDI